MPLRLVHDPGNTDSGAALPPCAQGERLGARTLTRQGAIDFRKPHDPLLIIAAEKDHLTHAAMVQRNARAYRHSVGVVDFKEFPCRSHFICNQNGWQEVAQYVFDWLGDH